MHLTLDFNPGGSRINSRVNFVEVFISWSVLLDAVDFLANFDAFDDEPDELGDNLTHLRDRSNPFENYDDREFRQRYRFTKETAHELINAVKDRLEKPTQRNNPLPPSLGMIYIIVWLIVFIHNITLL